ncbi:MAG TPA: hypothetical protein VGS07_19175 [Thermoanaerobaculia bacterium]|jgi:hypothetical protein|nr:hypothetical protein [Thermoanaerobaculia bacterium]
MDPETKLPTKSGPLMRTARYTSEDVHKALFETAPEPRTLEELKSGIRQYIKTRHADR